MADGSLLDCEQSLSSADLLARKDNEKNKARTLLAFTDDLHTLDIYARVQDLKKIERLSYFFSQSRPPTSPP